MLGTSGAAKKEERARGRDEGRGEGKKGGREGGRERGLRGLLEVGDQVLAVLGGLDTGEDHLRALDVVLGRQEVLEQSVLPPHDARVLVGGGVGVILRLARLPAKNAVQVRPLLVCTALFPFFGGTKRECG